jgi:hypothetical protein
MTKLGKEAGNMARIRSGPGWLAFCASAALVLAVPAVVRAAACAVTSADLDGNGTPDLKILGNSNPQHLEVQDDGTGLTVFLDCNGNNLFTDPPSSGDINGQFFPGIETLNVQLAGKDSIKYTQTGTWTGVVRNLQIILGPFANTLTIIGNGAINANSSFVLDLQGGPNLDTVTLDFSAASLSNSALIVYADLNSGSDVFTVHEPQANASKVDVRVNLGTGDNQALVDSAAPLVQSSSFRVNVEGDNNALYQHDRITTSFGGTFDDSRVLVNANLRDGEDFAVFHFPGSALSVLNGSELRVRASGNLSNDDLSVDDAGGTGAILNDGLIEAVLRGGPGIDTLDVNLNGMAGSGTLRVREHGGVQPDKIFCSILTDSTSTNALDLLVQGGRANDTVLSVVYDPGGNATFGPAGAAILDGGLENDACLAGGAASVETLNCEPGF